MRKAIAIAIVVVVFTVIVLPAIVIRCGEVLWQQEAEGKQERSYKNEDLFIRVYLHDSGKIVEMKLEDYIKGVVAAEMPAQFEMEALKAQAVAARTYAVKNMVVFGGGGATAHPGADVSTDFKEGQAWLNESGLKERWGEAAFPGYWQKINRAVEATAGQIVIYEGEPIQAVFHSTCGERTASAKEVWGFDYPYLRSVACTWDGKSPRYSETKEFALEKLENVLGSEVGVIAAAKSGGNPVVQVLGRTESGRVDSVRIGGKTISGMSLREKLDLKSTNFSVELQADKVIFKTIGYGHGVGLCQYGANGMAKEGKTYREILTYYYRGVELKNILAS